MKKSRAIVDAVQDLQLRLGPGSFDLLDYWPSDPDSIGIAAPGSDDPCVCILTAGKTPGRYDVEHGGSVFRDCLIQGLEWAVRHELQAHTHAEPDADTEVRVSARDSKARRGPRHN